MFNGVLVYITRSINLTYIADFSFFCQINMSKMLTLVFNNNNLAIDDKKQIEYNLEARQIVFNA